MGLGALLEPLRYWGRGYGCSIGASGGLEKGHAVGTSIGEPRDSRRGLHFTCLAKQGKNRIMIRILDIK